MIGVSNLITKSYFSALFLIWYVVVVVVFYFGRKIAPSAVYPGIYLFKNLFLNLLETEKKKKNHGRAHGSLPLTVRKVLGRLLLLGSLPVRLVLGRGKNSVLFPGAGY